MVDQLHSLTDILLIQSGIRAIGTDTLHLHRFPFTLAGLSIFRKIQDHRSRTAGTGYIESPANGPCHIFSTADLISPLGDRLGDPHKIDLLKGIRTQNSDTYLTGNHNNRSRIHHRISNPCKRICSSRATGHQTYPNLSAHTCKPFSSMSCSLFMTDQNMIKTFFLSSCISIHGIINRHNISSRIAKDSFYSFKTKRAHQCL